MSSFQSSKYSQSLGSAEVPPDAPAAQTTILPAGRPLQQVEEEPDEVIEVTAEEGTDWYRVALIAGLAAINTFGVTPSLVKMAKPDLNYTTRAAIGAAASLVVGGAIYLGKKMLTKESP